MYYIMDGEILNCRLSSVTILFNRLGFFSGFIGTPTKHLQEDQTYTYFNNKTGNSPRIVKLCKLIKID